MVRRLMLCLTGVIVFGLVVTALLGKGSAVPLVATFEPTLATTGVTGDGQGYANGVGGVSCYFGVSGKDVDLVTYNSARRLSFTFDPTTAAFQASGLPSASFLATVDLYGVNYYGPYQTMGIGTTATVQADLEFKLPGTSTTYGLLYKSMAVQRTAVDTWVLTTNPNDIPYDPVTTNSTATLYNIRHQKQMTLGTVSMPIRFEVTLK